MPKPALSPLALLAALGLAPPAAAQPLDSRGGITERAGDAFGERVGLDRVGLYGESQVRGFDLQGNGAYRIEGAYFGRAAGLSDAVSLGATVQVGAAAARQAQPSPSGVIEYRLRDPTDGVNQITLGLREFGTPAIEAIGSWTEEEGRRGAVGYVLARPGLRTDRYARGWGLDAGAVGAWRPADGIRLRAFASAGRSEHGGDTQVTPAGGGGLPPDLEDVNYAPDWARTRSTGYNLGALADLTRGDWRLDASVFRSGVDSDGADTAVLAAAESGAVTRSVLRTSPTETVSDSFEARLARTFASGPLVQRLSVAARGRRTETDLPATAATAPEAFDLGAGPPSIDPAPPERPRDAAGRDLVEQATFSVAWAAQWRDRIELRAGAHRTIYDKDVRLAGGGGSGGTTRAWLYNVSASWRVAGSLTLFGSYVTGLEETGTAPTAAVNRGEVLPPVRARQYELGAAYAFGEDLRLIAALFDIEKPINGLRSDGMFGPIGDVRHRGIEASATGRLGRDTTFVLGAVWNDPRLSGPGVVAGIVQPEPAGVSEFTATFSFDHRLAFAPGWSIDGLYLYEGGRRITSRGTRRSPPVVFTTLGTRWRIEAGGRPMELRLQALNPIGQGGYWATPSEILVPVTPRTVRALLTVPLG